MPEPKWHMSPTQAGKPGGPWHYDIGADDNENIALVYPAEDGHEVTEARAKLICEARETKRQRDRLLEAAEMAVPVVKDWIEGKVAEDEAIKRFCEAFAAETLDDLRAAIAECEEKDG